MTVREIAKLSGVSPATVSRYFQGAENVSEKTAIKIENILNSSKKDIKTLNRVKNEKTVVVLMQQLNLGFYAEVLNEISMQIKDFSFDVVFLARKDFETKGLYKLCKKLNVYGMIFLEEDINHDFIEKVKKLNIKIAFCGCDSLENGVTKIHINDMKAAYDGAKYLIGNGHRKIAFLSDFEYSLSSGFQRIIGCKKAFEEEKIPFDKKMIKHSYVTFEDGYNSTMELINSDREFTAIFAFSDELAHGAMSALFDNSINVPKDVSILGFDDLEISKRIRPMLSTVHQPIKDIVKKTLEVFNENEITDKEVLLYHSLKIRQSVFNIIK